MLEFLQKIDEHMFLVINGNNSPLFDGIMYWISGKFTWVPLYLFLIFWMMFRKRLKGLWILLFTLVLFAMTDSSSVHLFKNVFERLRPCHNPNLKNLVHLVNGHCGGKYGFISSHAANTFGMAVFLAIVFREKWLSVFLISWALIVSYSRIYLGVHYPFDVLAGILWGSILAYFIWKIYEYFFRNKSLTGTEPWNKTSSS